MCRKCLRLGQVVAELRSDLGYAKLYREEAPASRPSGLTPTRKRVSEAIDRGLVQFGPIVGVGGIVGTLPPEEFVAMIRSPAEWRTPDRGRLPHFQLSPGRLRAKFR